LSRGTKAKKGRSQEDATLADEKVEAQIRKEVGGPSSGELLGKKGKRHGGGTLGTHEREKRSP